MDETPWETALRDNEAEQRCQLFKDIFLKAQELSIPTCINLDKEGPRTSWLNEDFLVKIKNKKKMHRQRNQECVPGEEHRT